MVKSFVNELLDRGFGPLPMDSALVYDTEDACALECGIGVNRGPSYQYNETEKRWMGVDKNGVSVPLLDLRGLPRTTAD